MDIVFLVATVFAINAAASYQRTQCLCDVQIEMTSSDKWHVYMYLPIHDVYNIDINSIWNLI